jgi:hypothetical protein
MNWSIRRTAIEDLRRPHLHASERVGFVCCRAAQTTTGLMILAESYHRVTDDNYVEDFSVGARIGGDAFRNAMQLSLSNDVGIFHVHMHDHFGSPVPSRTDLIESRKFVPDFFNVTPHLPHGTLIFSKDSACGFCWLGKHVNPAPIDRIECVGSPYRIMNKYA